MTAYDDSNIFARILKGELPCHEVWQDESVLAFMDIAPMTSGHVLILPKAPSRNLLDADASVLSDLIVKVQRIARATKEALEADGIMIQQFNEAPAGQSVFHLHFHVLPRWQGKPLNAHAGEAAQPELLIRQAASIRRAMGG